MYSTANSSVGVVCFMASMRPLSLARPPDGRTFAMVPSSRVGVGCVEGRRSQSHQPPKSQSHRVRVPVPPSRFGGKYLPFRKSPAPHVPGWGRSIVAILALEPDPHRTDDLWLSDPESVSYTPLRA